MTLRIALLALLAPFIHLAAASQAPPATQQDLTPLLQRVAANMQRNDKLAVQYTSDELWTNLNFDKDGKPTGRESAKFENVFVEGLPYRRKVEANGKPLTGKEAEEEQKRYDKAVAERKGMTLDQKRHLFTFTYQSSLPMCCLTTLFDNHLLRHERLNGRDTLVVESVPRHGVRPKSEAEKSSLDWMETTWIDVEDEQPAKIEVVLLRNKGHFAKGMTGVIVFLRLAESAALIKGEPPHPVWLQQSSVSNFHFNMLWLHGSGVSKQVWSNFKRFRVDIRLLDGSLQELPKRRLNDHQLRAAARAFAIKRRTFSGSLRPGAASTPVTTSTPHGSS